MARVRVLNMGPKTPKGQIGRKGASERQKSSFGAKGAEGVQREFWTYDSTCTVTVPKQSEYVTKGAEHSWIRDFSTCGNRLWFKISFTTAEWCVHCNFFSMHGTMVRLNQPMSSIPTHRATAQDMLACSSVQDDGATVVHC